MLNWKNKYLSQQISKKFKNKQRKHGYYPKSFAVRKCKKYLKNECKKYQKHQCQYGTKKELKKLKKKHLKKCKCKFKTNKLKRNNKNSFCHDSIDYNFIKCSDLDCYGVLIDAPSIVSNYSYDGCSYLGFWSEEQQKEVLIIVDNRYDFEEMYNWKCLKSQQKNKYLSQIINKKFKNKHKNKKNRKQIKLISKRKKKRYRKYKNNIKKNNKSSTKNKNKIMIKRDYYEYQKLYDALDDIDDFNDNDDNESEYNHDEQLLIKKKEQQMTRSIISENEINIDCNGKDIFFLKSKTILYDNSMYSDWYYKLFKRNRINIILHYLLSGTHIISNTLHNMKYSQFNISNSSIISDTFTGNIVFNENGKFKYIIIDDMDMNKKKYWNKKIYHISSSNICKDKMCELYGKYRVLFEINVKILKSFKSQINRNELCWAYKCKDKFIMTANNVRLAKQNKLRLNQDINTLIAGYLAIYLNRYNMYIPIEIEQLIRCYFARYLQLDKTMNCISNFYTFIKSQSTHFLRNLNNKTIISKFGLIKNKSYSFKIKINSYFHSEYFKIGILANPHQFHKYIRKQVVYYVDYRWQYIVPKWWEHRKSRFYDFNLFDGDGMYSVNYGLTFVGNIIELVITSKNKLILKRNGKFLDIIDKFDTSYTYYPFISFESDLYTNTHKIIQLKPKTKSNKIIGDTDFCGYW